MKLIFHRGLCLKVAKSMVCDLNHQKLQSSVHSIELTLGGTMRKVSIL
jgi:hypothetical protein